MAAILREMHLSSHYSTVIARIERNGQVLGAGFLVADRHLMTCSHVVEGQDSSLQIVFLADPARPVEARVEYLTDPEAFDVALLTISEPVAGTQAVRLAYPNIGERFVATGFPKERPQGDTVEGRVLGSTLAQQVQLESTGARHITRRFSGTAVWSEARNAVLGMVVSFYAEDATAYMIPTGQLVASLEDCDPILFQKITNAIVKKTRTRVPPLLPYLNDRSVQNDKLDKALHEHLLSKSRRPFIAVIHGDDLEAHERYIDRLQVKTLPNVLKIEPIHIKKVAWSAPTGSLVERKARLLKNLAESILRHREPETKTLVAEIEHHRTPVLLSTFISSKDWMANDAQLIREWVMFWEKFPDLPNNKLLIFISLRYHSTSLVPQEQGQINGSIMSWPRKAWTAYWAAKNTRRNNQATRSFIENFNFHRPKDVTGIVLPELRGIVESDVEKWFERHVVEFCRLSPEDEVNPIVLGECFKPLVRRRYKQWENLTASNNIPMSILARDLRRHLTQCLSECTNS